MTIITACTSSRGSNGDGKTYSLVDSLATLGRNKVIITNIYSLASRSKNLKIGLDNFNPEILKYKGFPYYVYEKDFNKIQSFIETFEDASQYLIVYDEIFSLIEKGRLSKDVLSFLSQLRKRRVYLYTTCQEWLELNVTFRRYVRFQVACKMFNLFPFDFAISINEINDAYQMKWDNLENEYVCPRIKTTIKKCSKKIADSYDTFETIETSGKLVNSK